MNSTGLMFDRVATTEEIVSVIRRVSGNTAQGAKARLRVVIGRIAEVILPGLANEFDEGRISGRGRKLKVKLKRAIVHSRLRRAEQRDDPAAIEKTLLAYWNSDVGEEFYTAFVARFDRWFRGPHYRLVDILADAVAANPGFDRLVEVGCGDGRALVHLAERLPGLRELVGIDLNARIIARNVHVHGDLPRLRFVQTDARRWIEQEARDGTILFSYGGVLEYLCKSELTKIFERLGSYRDTAVALVEPVDPLHDLTSDAESHVHGQERTFSHNHVALLDACGFTIHFAEERNFDDVRWMMLFCTANPSNLPSNA